MMVLFAAGAALMIRSYRDEGAGRGTAAEKDADKGSSSSSGPPSEP
jgi:hypothetical protein